MSWSRRALLRHAGAVAAVIALGGCGFQPLYGSSGARTDASEQLSQVDIASIPNRYGQQLRNNLIDRFHFDGRPNQPAYRLEVGLDATEQKLALRKDASTERAQLVVLAPYRLIDQATGAVLLTASARAIVGYSILEEQYGSVVTVDAAYDRALRQIAEDITNRVAVRLVRGS